MRLTITLTLLLAVLAGCVAGCGPDSLMRWRPTEQQKQAADLTVKDVQALQPHVAPEAEIIRREAQQSAEITQTYMGLPVKRPWPVSPDNPETLDQAGQDASRPPPTTGQVVAAAADAGFSLTEILLAGAGSIAGAWGFGRARSKINAWRTGAASAETQVRESVRAINEIVRGIETLDPETKAKVKAAQKQSPATETLVSAARKP